MPSYAIVLSFQGWKVPRTQPLEASNSSSLPPFCLDGWQIRAVAYPYLWGFALPKVQTHVLMGSIILAVCFSMSIEGYSGVQTDSCGGVEPAHLITIHHISSLDLLGTLGFWRSRYQKCTRVRCRRQIRICAPLCFVEVSCFVEASWRTNAVFWNMEFDPGSLSSGNKEWDFSRAGAIARHPLAAIHLLGCYVPVTCCGQWHSLDWALLDMCIWTSSRLRLADSMPLYSL